MRIKITGYIRDKGRNGKIRHRVRVEGNKAKRIEIPVGPEIPEFWNYYYAARAGEAYQPPEPAQKSHKRSLAHAMDTYLAHLSKQVGNGLRSARTLKQRTSLFKAARAFSSPEGHTMGDMDYDLPAAAIVHIRDCWESSSQADNCVKAMSAMYDWLIERGLVEANPCKGVAKIHVSQGGATAWSADDLRQYLAHHSNPGPARVFLFLAMFTGARRGDLARLGREHEVTHQGVKCLHFQPEKKGSAPVTVPMFPQLVEEIRATGVIGKTYILNAHGQPFKGGDSLGMRVQRWTAEAGLSGRSAHGLRKALATLLAELGCSQQQISAVLSHTKASTSEVYTKSAERAVMARSAFEAIGHVRL